MRNENDKRCSPNYDKRLIRSCDNMATNRPQLLTIPLPCDAVDLTAGDDGDDEDAIDLTCASQQADVIEIHEIVDDEITPKTARSMRRLARESGAGATATSKSANTTSSFSYLLGPPSLATSASSACAIKSKAKDASKLRKQQQLEQKRRQSSQFQRSASTTSVRNSKAKRDTGFGKGRLFTPRITPRAPPPAPSHPTPQPKPKRESPKRRPAAQLVYGPVAPPPPAPPSNVVNTAYRTFVAGAHSFSSYPNPTPPSPQRQAPPSPSKQNHYGSASSAPTLSRDTYNASSHTFQDVSVVCHPAAGGSTDGTVKGLCATTALWRLPVDDTAACGHEDMSLSEQHISKVRACIQRSLQMEGGMNAQGQASISGWELSQIDVVYNPALERSFNAFRNASNPAACEVRLAWHGTSDTDEVLENISKTGFRIGPRAAHGPGVYTSESVLTALAYRTQREQMRGMPQPRATQQAMSAQQQVIQQYQLRLRQQHNFQPQQPTAPMRNVRVLLAQVCVTPATKKIDRVPAGRFIDMLVSPDPAGVRPRYIVHFKVPI